MLRQQTHKAVLNSGSLSTTVAYVLDHADLVVPKTYWIVMHSRKDVLPA